MAIYEGTFGSTTCEVHTNAAPGTTGEGRFEATPYVVEGSAIRQCAKNGAIVEGLPLSEHKGAIERAQRYLEETFGPLVGDLRVKTLPAVFIREVLPPKSVG